MAIYERMTVKGRTGVLPTYQSGGQAVAPGAKVSAHIDDRGGVMAAKAGAGVGDALEKFGKAVANADMTLVDGIRDYQKTKATELLTRYNQQMKEAMYGDGGFMTRKGEQAFNIDREIGQYSEKLKRDMLKEYGIPEDALSKELFYRMSEKTDSDNLLEVEKHRMGQWKEYQHRTWEAAIADAADDAVAHYSDAERFRGSMGLVMYHQEQILRDQGFSGEALEHGVRAGAGKIFKAAFKQALANSDLNGASWILAEGSRRFGDGESKYSYMGAEDIADCKLLLEQKREAERAKAERAAAHAAVVRQKELGLQEGQMTQAAAQIVWDSIKDEQDPEQRTAALILATRSMDPKRRDAVRKILGAQIKEDDAVRVATVSREASDFLKQNAGAPLTSMGSLIEASGVSDATKDFLRKQMESRIASTSDPKGLAVMKDTIAKGDFRSVDDMKVYAADRGFVITSDDMKELEARQRDAQSRSKEELQELERAKKNAKTMFESGRKWGNTSEGLKEDKVFDAYLLGKEEEWRATHDGKPMPLDVYRQTMAEGVAQVVVSQSWFGDTSVPTMSILSIPSAAVAEIRAQERAKGNTGLSDSKILQAWNDPKNKELREKYMSTGQSSGANPDEPVQPIDVFPFTR